MKHRALLVALIASVLISLSLGVWARFDAVEDPPPRQGPPAPRGLVVVDAAGTVVGPVLSLAPGTSAPLPLVAWQGAYHPPVVLGVLRDRLAGQLSTLFFETPDCSGTPFVPAPLASELLPLVVVAPPGSSLYQAQGTEPPRALRYRSILEGSTLLRPAQACTPVTPPGNLPQAIQAARVLDLDTQFTPPFRLQ